MGVRYEGFYMQLLLRECIHSFAIDDLVLRRLRTMILFIVSEAELVL